jgi:hypothetical protein
MQRNVDRCIHWVLGSPYAHPNFPQPPERAELKKGEFGWECTKTGMLYQEPFIKPSPENE